MDVCSKDFPQKSVNSRAGYTYNEILVTIVALGTLATLVIPYFNAYIIRAKQTIAKRELSTIYAAQKAFYSEYGTFHSNLQYIGYVPEGMTRYERNNWKGKNQHCINGSSLVENWAKESSPDDPNSSFGTPDKRYYSVGFNVNSGNAVVNRIRTLPFQCPIENSGHYYYGSTWPHVPRGGEFVATNTRFTVGATANLLSNFTSIKKSVRNFDGSINLSRMNLHDGMPIDVWTINELRQLRYKQVYYSAVLDDTTPITGSPEGIDPDTGSNGYPQGDSDSESENGDDDNENASNENNGEETNSDSEGEAEASYGSFQFSFQGLGNENTYGAYIDNVSLFNANYYSDDYDAQNCGENCYQNLITNGSFEEGHGLGNKGWNVYASIPGWTAITEISDAPIEIQNGNIGGLCLLYTSPSPRDSCASRMPSSA